VPVRLGTIAGEVVAKEMDRLSERNWEPYESKPDAFRIVYVQSHVRTRMWYKKGEALVWEDGSENDEAAYSAPKTSRKVASI